MSISAELEQRIHEAIETIVERGAKPTYEAIRAESGSAFNSIKPALISWRARKTEVADIPQEEISKVDINQTLKAELLALCEQGLDRVMMTATKDAVDKAGAQAIADREDYEARIAKLEGEVEEAEEYASSIEKVSDEIRKSLADNVNKLEEQGLKLKAAIDKNSVLERDVETLTTNNLSLNEDNKALNTQLVQARAEVQILTDTVETAKGKFDKLDGEHTALTKKYNQLVELSSEHKGDLKSANKTVADVRSEMVELRSKHDAYVTEIATLKALNIQLEEIIQQSTVAQGNQISP